MDYNTTERMMIRVAQMTDADFESHLLIFSGDDFWNASARDMLVDLRKAGQEMLGEVNGFRIEIEQYGKLSNLTEDQYRKIYSGTVHFSDRVVPVEIITNTYSYQTICDTIKKTLSFEEGFKAGFVECGCTTIHSYVADFPEEHAYDVYDMLVEIYQKMKDLDVADYIEMEMAERQKSRNRAVFSSRYTIEDSEDDGYCD